MATGGSTHDTLGRPDPSKINTLAELTSALLSLIAGRSSTEINRHLSPLNKIGKSTLSNVRNGRGLLSVDTMTKILDGCGVPESERLAWVAARRRADSEPAAGSSLGRRVDAINPRNLGVHASIQTKAGDTSLPPYIARDVDQPLRTAVTEATERGGFILLVGRSSVGKTRTAYEAVRAVTPRSWLHHPADAGTVRELVSRTGHRHVIWLDEFQRYLDRSPRLPRPQSVN
jgi:hypothetical protein